LKPEELIQKLNHLVISKPDIKNKCTWSILIKYNNYSINLIKKLFIVKAEGSTLGVSLILNGCELKC
jgi:hypothetical protein